MCIYSIYVCVTVCVCRWEAVQVCWVFVRFYRSQLSAQTLQNSQSGETVQVSTVRLQQVTHLTHTLSIATWASPLWSVTSCHVSFLPQHPEEESGPPRSPSSHRRGVSMPTVRVLQSRPSTAAATCPQTPRPLPACRTVMLTGDRTLSLDC